MSGASALEAVLRCAATVEVAESLDQVRDDVRRFCAGLGYDRFMLFSTSAAQSEPVERIYWLEGDWFGTGEAVDAKTYMQRCPVTRHVVTAREPFFWTKTRRSADGELYRIVTTPRGPGIHGLQVPLFGPLGLEGAMSLGGREHRRQRPSALGREGRGRGRVSGRASIAGTTPGGRAGSVIHA
ncbi:autoinducer binding domain-containing protein [Pseudomonas sp. SC11]|uniref:autoinducer binding domain-containing protein n=1 Tax=Pseudomonas sp. SC11 TaxID=326927 RepID=UPI00399B5E0C